MHVCTMKKNRPHVSNLYLIILSMQWRDKAKSQRKLEVYPTNKRETLWFAVSTTNFRSLFFCLSPRLLLLILRSPPQNRDCCLPTAFPLRHFTRGSIDCSHCILAGVEMVQVTGPAKKKKKRRTEGSVSPVNDPTAWRFESPAGDPFLSKSQLQVWRGF